jgi:hypothetical protein
MRFRPGKLLLIALVPVALYGAAKGLMYFKAKSAVDDIVTAAANQADIRYEGISTTILGAVTVEGITVTPRGYTDEVQIDAVQVASDDPMFLIRGWDWGPGQSEPPEHLALKVTGLRMPLDTELFAEFSAAREAAGAAVDPCAEGPSLEPELLKSLGFTELNVDLGGHYRLDKTNLSMTAAWEMVVKDLQSVEMSIEMSDVDTASFAQGAPPQMNLAGFRVAVDVAPEFGRQALKACAAGTELTVGQWSDRFADQFIQELEAEGVGLGSGLQRAVRSFYKDWGTVEIVAAPAEPVGILSLMFLPPNRLADALSLRLIMNDQLITDTRFTWERPDKPALSSLFGAEPEGQADTAAAPRRIIVRRNYEPVATGDLGRYVDHNVRIKPRGQPMREGLLLRIANGEAEVEQTLHGGKFTVYVPLAQIDSVEALVQRQVKPLP